MSNVINERNKRIDDRSQTINWKSLILQSGWLERLDRVTTKRFGEGGLAEEASAYVIDKLSANSWQVFNSFKGQSKPETYLHTLANNFIEEFSRKRFGRPRPPEWLKRQGDLWIKVWKMLCLERRLPQTVIELLCTEQLREANTVQSVIQTVKARLPWCGESAREIASQPLGQGEDQVAAEDRIADFHTPETVIEADHLRDVLQMLGNLLNKNPHAEMNNIVTERVETMVHQAGAQQTVNLGKVLELTDQEWVILRMVYQDGMKLKTVAGCLGLKDHEPGRIMKTTLQRIAASLTTLGVNMESFRTQLQQ